jgi:hypothetical protein
MDKDVAFDVINWKVRTRRTREEEGGGRMRRMRSNLVSMFFFMVEVS